MEGSARPPKKVLIMENDFILCADCGQETPTDRLSPSFGLCPACERKHQQRPVSWDGRTEKIES